MKFGGDDVQSASIADRVGKDDVSPSASQIRGNGNAWFLPGLSNDSCFLMKILGVQNLGDEATLRINGEEVATSNPKRNDSREISIEGGGKQSQGYSEFYDFELEITDQMGQ